MSQVTSLHLYGFETLVCIHLPGLDSHGSEVRHAEQRKPLTSVAFLFT